MPSEPIIIDLLDNLVRTLRGMSKANGYHYDYEDVVLGFYDWGAEPSFATPRILVVPRMAGPELPLGREMSRSRFRWEDKYDLIVHLKNEDGDIVRPALRVRADFMKVFAVDRNRGTTVVTANTFYVGCDFAFFAKQGEKMLLGATVTTTFTIRWEHSTGDMTASPS